MTAAFTENIKRTKPFPQSDQELHQALGDSFDNLRDPWGRPYYNTFKPQAINTGRVQLENRATFGAAPSMQTNVTPVTETVGFVIMRSMGPDAKAGTSDDFSVATFAGVISEQPRESTAPDSFTSGLVLSGSSGAIVGVVTDPVGAVVPGTTVGAKRLPAGPTYETSTNDDGRYSFASLPPGLYELTFDAVGFTRNAITQVLVRPHNLDAGDCKRARCDVVTVRG